MEDRLAILQTTFKPHKKSLSIDKNQIKLGSCLNIQNLDLTYTKIFLTKWLLKLKNYNNLTRLNAIMGLFKFSTRFIISAEYFKDDDVFLLFGVVCLEKTRINIKSCNFSKRSRVIWKCFKFFIRGYVRFRKGHLERH